MDKGEYVATEEGSAQGNIISPILANIYMHFVLKKRMSKFGLELESSKSKIIKFGKYAEQSRKQLGEGKPETFDFLGFTLSLLWNFTQ